MMHEPLFRLKRGEHVTLKMMNNTDFEHPVHLHGHFFRVLALNDVKSRRREWRDTVMIDPRGSADIAFVALEFGTYQPPRGGRVLQADHWLWNHGDPTGPEAVPIRNALRDHFYPPFDDWKEMVLWRSRQVFAQGLKGLSS